MLGIFFDFLKFILIHLFSFFFVCLFYYSLFIRILMLTFPVHCDNNLHFLFIMIIFLYYSIVIKICSFY